MNWLVAIITLLVLFAFLAQIPIGVWIALIIILIIIGAIKN